MCVEIVKPKCKIIALVGIGVGLAQLVEIVNSTLKNAGQRERATEFCTKVQQCESYNEALALMGDYVEIDY